MAAKLTAVQARAQDPEFVRQCTFEELQKQLPLCWPTPPDVPPSPKRSYRSHYTYLGWQDLQDPAEWAELSEFDLVLRLIDFSGLRPVLAQRLGWTSAQGQVPFDPVSLFLSHGWQITSKWSRAETLRQLPKKRNADYAERFGFVDGIYPTEGGLRYFLTALGHHSDASGETVTVELDEERTVKIAIQYLNQLLVGAVDLVREAGLFSPEAWTQGLLCPDGMLHPAASRMRCASVGDNCYQPLTADVPRICAAKEKDRKGCDCDTRACTTACQSATPRDAEARFVWYEGSNQRPNNPNRSTDPNHSQKSKGKGVYGYRSLPLLLADPIRRFHLSLLADFLPASAREEVPAAALLLQLGHFYPDLDLDAFVGDAGFGFDVVLRLVHQLGARRVVDLRADKSDRDKAGWLTRGYDDKGRPICPFGYPFTANGYDAKRRRCKWFCAKACLHDVEPVIQVKGARYPPPECPHQDSKSPRGYILNIGLAFADKSTRLVRDVPVGSSTWKRLYHQARNASESRNGTFEHWNLKRLPVYGGLRAKAFTYLADTWDTLTTMARLIREATFATSSA